MKHLIALLLFSAFMACCQQVEKDIAETSVKILEDAENDIVQEVVKEVSGEDTTTTSPSSKS